MDDHNKIPLMLEMLFGEAAGPARWGASERLLGWCRAFDEWLGDLQRKYKPGRARMSVCAWQCLLGQCPKMPWEIGPADIAAHAAWLKAQGYAPTTVRDALRAFSDYYNWCGERGVDPECGASFNPAAGAPRPVIRRFAGAKLLSLAQAQALLGIMRRDTSPLGMRDYAFFLARLRLGVPLAALRRLQWGQIEADGVEARVRWRPEAEPVPLPEEVWEALLAYLRASGRLPGMRPEAYIFAPLIENVSKAAGSTPEDWREGRCLLNNQMLRISKLYGRLVGIPEDKLTMNALRNTAIRLQMDTGCSIEEMQTFLNCQEARWMTRSRLRCLPQLPQEGQAGVEQDGDEPPIPGRKGKLFKPGENMTHGMYARSLPLEEVRAVLAEDIQGVDEQIIGLRTLARGLLARHAEARGSAEAALLGEAYSQEAGHLEELIKAEKELEENLEGSDWADQVLLMCDQVALEMGQAPVSQAFREEVLRGEPEMVEASRRLVEEAAAMRFVLRNTFRLATQARELEECVRLVGIYGRGCMRLARLLKANRGVEARIEAKLHEMIDQALQEVREELGIL